MGKKIAVVTGAGSGIGKAIARELANRDFKVVVTDLDVAAAEATSKLITDSIFLKLDVTNPDQSQQIFAWRAGCLGFKCWNIKNAKVC